MCHFCSQKKILDKGGYGYIVASEKDATMITKCQPTYDDSATRELLMYHLLDHPNIPKISNVTLVNQDRKDYVHFDMKRLTSFPDYIQYYNPDTEIRKNIYLDIIDALAYIQSRNVYHQDIRPENILIDTTTDKAYLIDFGLACDTFVSRSGWTDPLITEFYYTEYEAPSTKVMMKGDSWSLGLLGLYLFCDEEIYEWTNQFDDECMDVAYSLRGRFDFGLDRAHLDLDEIPEDILGIIKCLMNRRNITNGYKSDMINMEHFNTLDTIEKLKYIEKLYDENGKPFCYLENYAE